MTCVQTRTDASAATHRTPRANTTTAAPTNLKRSNSDVAGSSSLNVDGGSDSKRNRTDSATGQAALARLMARHSTQ